MNKISFNTTLKRPEGIGTWHYVDTPIETEKAFGTKGKVRIDGKIKGVEFKATLIPRGNGEHYVVLDKTIRETTRIEIGDSFEMEIWEDKSERRVEIPADFQEKYHG